MRAGQSWGRGEGWSKVIALIEIARRGDAGEWTAERRERVYEQVMARAERERARRRMMRALAAGVSTLLLVAVMFGLFSAGGSSLALRL